jgi:hypothetical protein
LKKKTVLGQAAAKVVAKNNLGDEPVFTAEVNNSSLIAALNWYNYFWDSEQAKESALAYLEKIGATLVTVQHVSRLASHEFRTAGYLARMVLRGAQFDDDLKQRFHERLRVLIEKSKKSEEVSTRTVKDPSDKFIADIEDEIDKFCSEFSSDFKLFDFVQSKEIKSYTVRKISDKYRSLLDELILAVSGKDSQVNEAYSCYSKKQLKSYHDFVAAIIADCDQIVSTAKVTRKPRKRRVVSTEKIVSKVTFKNDDSKYKVKSIHPTEIVKAKTLWTFNTKTRKLSLFVASNDEGLSIKGTTIQNYNETTSIQKNLRKPEDVLSEVVQGGKIVLRNLMTKIKSKESPVSGRINSDTILLRVTK